MLFYFKLFNSLGGLSVNVEPKYFWKKLLPSLIAFVLSFTVILLAGSHPLSVALHTGLVQGVSAWAVVVTIRLLLESVLHTPQLTNMSIVKIIVVTVWLRILLFFVVKTSVFFEPLYSHFTPVQLFCVVVSLPVMFGVEFYFNPLPVNDWLRDNKK